MSEDIKETLEVEETPVEAEAPKPRKRRRKKATPKKEAMPEDTYVLPEEPPAPVKRDIGAVLLPAQQPSSRGEAVVAKFLARRAKRNGG